MKTTFILLLTLTLLTVMLSVGVAAQNTSTPTPAQPPAPAPGGQVIPPAMQPDQGALPPGTPPQPAGAPQGAAGIPGPQTTNPVTTTGGVTTVPANAPLITTPSMDLGGPLTPPVVRTAPTVVVVTPSPISTPTVVTAPAAPGTGQTVAPAAGQGGPMNLGAARMGTAFESSDMRSLGDIAAQYRKKDGVQNASRVYTNEDIARLNREQARDLDLPASDRDASEDENQDGKGKTTPVAPATPR